MLSNLLVVGIFISLLVPSALMKQWWLFFAFFMFGVQFGGLELLAKIQSTKTVSENFWTLGRMQALFILAFMEIGWNCLILHLWMGVKK